VSPAARFWLATPVLRSHYSQHPRAACRQVLH
jgi:hypothetical protein